MGDLLPWLIFVGIVLGLSPLIRWSKKYARGIVGGGAMALDLAFGHLFDPARARAIEQVQKKQESHREEAEAGAPPGSAEI